jgi:predicted permease
MHKLIQDFRFAFRQMVKNPGFALTAILSLALGIGATTAVFSVIYAVLVNPYPYKNPERLVHLVITDRAGHERWPALSFPQIQRLRQLSGIDSVIGQDDWSLTTTGEDLPEDVEAVYFTNNAFRHFGVPALLGREFGASDAPEGHDPQPVVVLSYKFWQRHYGGDRQVIGRPIQLVHKTYTIIGVLPPRFTWGGGTGAYVYLPLKVTADPARKFSPYIRLRPGVSYLAADAQLQPVLEQFAKDEPSQWPEHFQVRIHGLNDTFVKLLGQTLYLLLGGVALLLLIGCANVSILLLARGSAREHELAVRAAIGAGRLRILTQLLIESLSLSLAGAFLGILMAYRIVALIGAWLPEGSFPNEAAIEINFPVLLFSIGLALLTGVVFGLSPALSLSRPEIAQVIQTNTRKASGGLKGRRTHSILIAGQIALTVVLMTAAGAAIGGFLKLMHASLGYDPHNVMSVGIPVHDNSYMTWAQRSAYFDQLRQKIAVMPEVVSAGISANATPPDNGWETNFEIFGRPASEVLQVRANFVSLEYFSVLHIPLRQGSLWEHSDDMRGARVGVINETMAQKYWPNGDAVGRQMRLPKLKGDPPYSQTPANSDGWFQIVGIVADARDDGLRNAVKPAVYLPYTMSMRMFTQILVRAKTDPLAILHSVRTQVSTVNSEQQVNGDVRSLEQWITTNPEWAQQRLIAMLFGAFAVLALVLAAVGLYGVVSYTVAQRTNEIGIRMSLGARRDHILKLVFGGTAVSVGIGLLVGIGLSAGLNKLLERWAEGSSGDPFIVLSVAAVLAVTSAAACFFPARRASSVDPMIALRYE